MTRSLPQPQFFLRRCSKIAFPILRALLTAGGLWGALGGLAACSAVPDAVNPVEWYQGVEGWFESDAEKQDRLAEEAAREKTPLPGTGKDYPNLATVPNRPKVTPSAERGKIAQGLAADRENARYAETRPSRAVPAPAPGNGQTAEETPPAAVSSAPEAATPASSAAQTQMPARSSPAATPPAVPVQAQETPIPVPTRSEGPGSAFPLGMTQYATVFFANNSATIDAQGMGELRKLAAGFKENGGHLRIVAFASGSPRTASAKLANFRISSQRAEAVAQALVRLGVPMARMTVSTGDAGPVGDAALARRVEVALDY